MLPRLTALSLLALAAGALHAAPVTYTLEPNYTQAIFRWNHLGFSNPAAQIGQGEGTVSFDAEEPARSSVSVSFPLSALSTGVPALDEHLKSDDFFDAERFPTATFHSSRVTRGAGHNRFEVRGQLTLRDVTQPVTLAVTLLKIGTDPRTGLASIGFDATVTLRRSAFGLGKYIPQVGDEIPVRLTSQAAEAGAYARYLRDQAAADAAEAQKNAATPGTAH